MIHEATFCTSRYSAFLLATRIDDFRLHVCCIVLPSGAVSQIYRLAELWLKAARPPFTNAHDLASSSWGKDECAAFALAVSIGECVSDILAAA